MEYNNYKNIESGCNKYGKDRLELATFLHKTLLSTLDIAYTIENGTLLGAFRNKKFIPHDDDFDFAIFIKNIEEIKGIYQFIKNHLPDTYSCRLVESYCLKIEVFDKSKGSYILQGPQYKGADYHHVTADLQFYVYNPETNSYKQLYYAYTNPAIHTKNTIFPIQFITLENTLFPAPNNVKVFLENIYGCIEEGATYNSITHKYEKKN